MRGDQRQAPARQRRVRLLVDAAGVADAARQQARQPARRVADGAAGLVEQAGDADLADEAGRLAAQRVERVGAVRDPFVGVEDQAPGRFGQRERGVAGGGEVVDPFEARDASAEAARDLGRRVERAGVEHDHLVDPRAGADAGSARGCALRRERSSPARLHSWSKRGASAQATKPWITARAPAYIEKNAKGPLSRPIPTQRSRRFRTPSELSPQVQKTLLDNPANAPGVRVRGPVSRPRVGQHRLLDTTVD